MATGIKRIADRLHWISANLGVLSGGSSDYPLTLRTYAQKGFEFYFTSPSTDADNSVRSIYMKTTMAGIGGVGGRAEFHMYTNVALGGWSNAIKGFAEYGAAGKTTGLGSAVCAELTLSAGTVNGHYAPLELELNVPSGASLGTKTAFMHLSVQGTDIATFKSGGYLFSLIGPTDTANGMFDATDVNDPDFTHALRININGVDYFIGLSTAVAFNA